MPDTAGACSLASWVALGHHRAPQACSSGPPPTPHMQSGNRQFLLTKGGVFGYLGGCVLPQGGCAQGINLFWSKMLPTVGTLLLRLEVGGLTLSPSEFCPKGALVRPWGRQGLW